MFQHIDFIETPGVWICLIPCDKYDLAIKWLHAENITSTVKVEEVVVNAVEAPEIEIETAVEVIAKDATEAVIADAVEDEVITEEEAEEVIEKTVNDGAVDATKYAVSQSQITKQEPSKEPIKYNDWDLPF